VEFVVSGPVDWEPLIGIDPVQAPEPLQAVALLVVHVTVELAPAAIDAGVALRFTRGAGEATVTVIDCVAVPPAPVQVSVKLVVVVSAAVICVPLGAMLPLQPPLAVQLVASVAVQLSSVLVPGSTVVACAERFTAGVGVGALATTCPDLMFAPAVAVVPETSLTLEIPELLQADSIANVSEARINGQPNLDPIKHLPGASLVAQRHAETEQI
jgi:hypothetical protein